MRLCLGTYLLAVFNCPNNVLLSSILYLQLFKHEHTTKAKQKSKVFIYYNITTHCYLHNQIVFQLHDFFTDSNTTTSTNRKENIWRSKNVYKMMITGQC